MSSLWIPESRPPQMSDEARTDLENELLGDGVVETYRNAFGILEDAQPSLTDYLDRFGYELNGLSSELYWPERALKIGAAISYLGYRKTGFYQTIDDDTFALSKMLAELDGVPDAYFKSIYDDPVLQSLFSTLKDAQYFQTTDPEGYYQVLDIGAGCVRFYMQQAVEATAA